MKNKLVIVISLSITFILASCSSLQDKKHSEISQNINTWTWRLNIWSDNKVNVQKVVKQNNKFNVKKISAFNKAILEIAIKWWIEKCKLYQGDKKQCEDFVKKQKQLLNSWKCDALLFNKDQCLDKKYSEEWKCDKIKVELTRRQCFVQKEFDNIVKEKNIKACSKFAYPMKWECISAIKKLLTK